MLTVVQGFSWLKLFIVCFAALTDTNAEGNNRERCIDRCPCQGLPSTNSPILALISMCDSVLLYRCVQYNVLKALVLKMFMVNSNYEIKFNAKFLSCTF